MNIKIKKLFKERDYNIDFNNQLNIIIGENGCGKSTILKMIDNIVNNDFISLSMYEFDEIKIEINKKIFNIKYEELLQIPFTANPEFRELLFKINYSEFKTYTDFYKYCFHESHNFRKYNSISYKINDYIFNNDLFLEDDLHYIKNMEYYNYMKKYKVIYGSEIYLKCVYCYFKNENPFSELNSNFSKSLYCPFIDLDEKIQTYVNSESVKVVELLQNYLVDKNITLENDKFIFSDKFTNQIIDYSFLSSGEKKIIKLIDTLFKCEENDILILDEPELSLSIFWQRQFISDLMSLCCAKKIFIATQSNNFLEYSELKYLVPLYYEWEA